MRKITEIIRKLIGVFEKCDQEFNLICECQKSKDTQANDRKNVKMNDKFTQVNFTASRPRRQMESRIASLQTNNFGTENMAVARFGSPPPAGNIGPSACVARQTQNFSAHNFTAVRFASPPPVANFGPSAYVARQPQHFGMENFTAVRFASPPPVANFGPSAYVARQPQNFGMENLTAVRFTSPMHHR